MASPNQAARHEASMLAAGLAVAGTVFMSDRLNSMAHHGALVSEVFLPVAAVVLVTVGVCLLVVEWPVETTVRSNTFRVKDNRNSTGGSSRASRPNSG